MRSLQVNESIFSWKSSSGDYWDDSSDESPESSSESSDPRHGYELQGNVLERGNEDQRALLAT